MGKPRKIRKYPTYPEIPKSKKDTWKYPIVSRGRRLMANTILNFHFDYRHPSLSPKIFQLFFTPSLKKNCVQPNVGSNVTERNNIGSRSRKAYCHEEKTSERHFASFASWICANCGVALEYLISYI